MTYTIEKFNSWLENQDYWRQKLGVSGGNAIRCFPYHGLSHALTDLLFGLKFFWPTKKNLLISSWGSPLLLPNVQAFVREGHSLLHKPSLDSEESPLSELPREMLAAVLVRDHGFTGEILTSDEELQILNDKRMPHIEIQHAWAWSRAQDPLPFGAQIRILDAQKAIVVAGSRFRFMDHSARGMDWSGLMWEDEIHRNKSESSEDQKGLESFEKELRSLQPKIHLYSLSSSQRLYDRLLLEVQGLHGAYFLEMLLQQIQEAPLRGSGFESRCETTNLTRWGGMHPWKWWGKTLLSEEQQRSLVVLSNSFLKKHLTPNIVNKVYLECQSLTQSPSNKVG